MGEPIKHLDINHNHEAGLIPVATQRYIRQQASEIERLNAERDDLMKAVKALLDCPVIADRDLEPAWLCQETAEAVELAAGLLLKAHRAKARAAIRSEGDE